MSREIPISRFWRRWMISAFALAGSAAFGFPTVEPFADASAIGGTTYAVGASLAGQTNAAGEVWFGVNTSSVAPPVSVVSDALVYPGLPPSTGNAILLRNTNGPGARLFLATNPNNFFFSTNNVTLYYSLLLRAKDITSLTSDGAFVLGFSAVTTVGDSTGQGISPIQGARLNFRLVNSTNYQIGIAKNSTTVAYDPNLYTTNDVLFVVAAYEIVYNATNGSSVDDTVRLWVNPSPLTFGTANQPSETTGILGSTADATAITSFAVLQRSTVAPNLLVIDELRLGTNWTSVTGGAAEVYVTPPITNLNYGSTLNLTAFVNGPGLLGADFQWQHNGTNLVNDSRVSGAVTTNLIIGNVSALDAGSYSVIAFTATNSVTNFATVTVNDPVILAQPASLAFSIATTVQLSVNAIGTPPLSYQWRFNGTNLSDGTHISGVNSTNLSINTIQAADSGLYSVVVSGAAGSVTSSPAALIPYEAPEPPFGAQLISAEYFWDADPGQGNGTNVIFSANEAVIFGDSITPPFNANIGSLSPGVHRLGFRAKDADERWGDTTWIPIEIKDPNAIIAEVTAWPPQETNQWLVTMEYFWDTDPGEGLGIGTNFPAGETLILGASNSPALLADLSSLAPGIHQLGFRVFDAGGRWGQPAWIPVEVKDANAIIAEVTAWPPNEMNQWLVAAEYFWDTDPGTNNGTFVALAPGETSTFGPEINTLLNLPVPHLPLGNHQLGFRVKDARGVWSDTQRIGILLDRKTEFNLATAITVLTNTNTNSFAVATISCPGPGQTCSNTFDLPVETESLLNVHFTSASSNCSDLRIHFKVDGTERAVSARLPAGASSGWFALGPVSPGAHELQLQAEGFLGGCNVGTLNSWAGSLQVVTTSLATNVAGGEFTHTTNNANGISLADFNNDGYPDIFLTTDDRAAIFVNAGNGALNQTDLPPSLVTNAQSGAWGDFDNDGALDLLVTTGNRSVAERNLLFRNFGGTNFDLLALTNFPSTESDSFVSAWADVDGDGFVDAVIGRTNGVRLELYRNLGDGSFVNLAASSNLVSGGVRSLAFGDFDNDWRPDLICAGNGGLHLFRNFGTNQFLELIGTGLASDVTATSVSWADYDCDGWLDLFLASSDHLGALFHNNHDFTFTQVQIETFNVPGFCAASCAWEDFDQDGRLDLFVASGATNFESRFFHNHPSGVFELLTNNTPNVPTGVYAGSAWADMNRDGRPDLLIAARGGTNVLAQNTGSGAGWLRVKLSGRPSNKAAIGARVSVLANIDGESFWQTREISGGNGSQSELPITFGLGDAADVNSLVIEWPSGLETIYTNLALNQVMNISELPDGQPVVTVNQTFQASGQYSFVSLNPVTVSIDSPFQNGWVFYTTDGSEPDFLANWYTGPFQISPPAIIRAIAYDAALTKQAFGDPAELILVPTFFLTNSTPGGGNFSLSPPGPNYLSNTVVTAVATNWPGWTFMNWAGDLAGTNPTNTFAMNSHKNVRAVFGTTLMNTVLGGAEFGVVTTSPLNSLYAYDSSPRLTALPAAGKYFVRWTLSGSSATNLVENPMDWPMTNAEPSFIALFANLPTNTFSLTVLKNGNGTVTRSPNAGFYTNGTQVTLTASPPFGEFFLGWSGDAMSPQNPITVTMNSSKVITANFGLMPPLFSFGAPVYQTSETSGAVALSIRNNGVPGTVDFATMDGSALGGAAGNAADFVATNGTVAFAYGETNKTIFIRVNNRYLRDADKSFQVQLSNATGGSSSITNPASATVVIHYDTALDSTNSLLVQAAPAPVPDRSGSLRVTLVPPTPTVDGGFWRFPWELAWRASGELVTNLIGDDYPVEFRQLPGYQVSSVPIQPILANGFTTELTNQYIVVGPTAAGRLTVQIGPNNPIVITNAGWRLLGENFWRSPGSTVSNVAPGNQVIEFRTVTGLAAPPAREVAVFASQESVITAYYELPSMLPPGAALPAPLTDLEYINSSFAASPRMPFTFNGQLQTDIGVGSGVAALSNVVLTAAHVVFNDATLSYAGEVSWFFQKHTGELDPKPEIARGWYVLSGYAAARTNDLPPVGNLSPGQSSAQSRSLDVAAIYFLSPTARGGFGGYLASDAPVNEWLTSDQPKMLVGYPLDGTQFSYSNVVKGKMHSTIVSNFTFTLQTDRVYATTDFLNFPGNSGGPLYVLCTNDVFYPAAVYLGTVGSASVVRAIDSDVVNLLNLAQLSATFGDAGTNFTGGGVIRVVSGATGGSGKGYLQVRIGPAAAITAGGGWRLSGSASPFSSNPIFTETVTNGQSFSIEFAPTIGWNLPPEQNVTVPLNQLTIIDVTYSVVPPLLTFNGAGLGITGTTNTSYRIEFRTNLTIGAWQTLRTNKISSIGFDLVAPWPLTNGARAFYRAVWLP